MSMISDLVDKLRVESKSMGKYGIDYMATLLMRAADTIEMLSEKVRADRPRGEWIDNRDIGTFKIWDCSNCGIHMEARWNYCPNCGCRMKGVDNE